MRPDVGEPRTSERIRAEIDRTRANLDATVDELQSRLSLNNLARRGLQTIGDGASSAARNVSALVRDNPVPTAVIAAGLAWLIVSKVRAKRHSNRTWSRNDIGEYEGDDYTGAELIGTHGSRESRLGHKAGHISHKASEAAQHVGRNIKHKAGHVGTRVKDRVQDVGSMMAQTADDVRAFARHKAANLSRHLQDRAERGKEWFADTVDEYPLAVGAAFFALGLAGAMAVPISRHEDELLGPTRDDLIDRAQSMGSDLIHRGEEAAQRAVIAARQAVEIETARLERELP